MNDIHDILEPMKPEFSVMEIATFVTLLCLAIALGFFVLKKIKKVKKIESRPLSVFDLTQRELDILISKSQEVEDKQFTSKASSILREYIEKTLRIPAPERTTEEFLDDLSDFNLIPQSSSDSLANFMQRCDLSKFARQSLILEEKEKLINTAKQVVYQIDKHQRAISHSEELS